MKLMISKRQKINRVSSVAAPASHLELGSIGRGVLWTLSWGPNKTEMSRVFSFSSSLPVLPQDRVLGRRELQRENSEVLPKCPLSIQLGSDGYTGRNYPRLRSGEEPGRWQSQGLTQGRKYYSFPQSRLENSMTLRAMGRVLLRVLPQQQGIIAPRLHATSTPPENSIPN